MSKRLKKFFLIILVLLSLKNFLNPNSARAGDGFGDGEGMGIPGGGDTSPPSVTSFTPADNATEASVSANLSINFNEVVNCQASKYLSIFLSSNNSLFESIESTSPNISGCNTSSITINPSSNFANSTSYYVQIDSGTFQDSASNSYAGIADTTSWNFATESAVDSSPPTVSGLSPADNATGISGTANLVITFSENIVKGTGNIVIKNFSDGSVLETIAVTDASVTVSTNTVTINPSTTLPSGTEVYVEIASTAIKDSSDNYYAGITGSTSWNFTIADTGAPTVSSFSPLDNATGVSVDSNLVINFSESVNAIDGAIWVGEALVNPNPYKVTIKRLDNSSILETIYTNSARMTGSGTSTITIDPINSLPSETAIYINIEAGAFADASSNAYAGINDSTTWNFTTADTTAPTIFSLSPADDSTQVLLSSNLVITFSENIFAGTGNILIKKSSDNSIAQTISVSSLNVTISGMQVTINPPSDLLAWTQYYIQIPNTAFTDSSGNAYAGINDTSSWNFTTSTYPEVSATYPPTQDSFYNFTNAQVQFTEDISLTPGSSSLVCRTTSYSGDVVYSKPLSEASITANNQIIKLPDMTHAFYSAPGYPIFCSIESSAIKSDATQVGNPNGYFFELRVTPSLILP